MHLFMLNRGILMTPFHNMALMCPETTENDIN
jgi:glutamate-1-semialdehyde 2,1-aminomutase